VSYIKNYENLTKELSSFGSWYYEEITEINYTVKRDFDDNYITILYLEFLISVKEKNRLFKMKVRYDGVSELCLREVTNLCLERSLIIHDKKELGWDLRKRYHVHDDSGYGENDGYDFISFYCRNMEAIELEEVQIFNI